MTRRESAAFNPDIVVLDVMLSDQDGFVAGQLRRAGNDVLVLFLTARDAVQDRIAGLIAGGDDYVTKPFGLDEVVLRLRAILRRVLPDQTSDSTLRYRDLELGEDTYEVRRAGRLVNLSPTEFKLLRYLMINAEKVVSKVQTLDRVWNYEFGGDSRIVESYISYLRRKIDFASPPLIHIIRPCTPEADLNREVVESWWSACLPVRVSVQGAVGGSPEYVGSAHHSASAEGGLGDPQRPARSMRLARSAWGGSPSNSADPSR